MERAKKEALVAELHQTFEESDLVVLTQQKGLTVAEVSELRRRMREAGAKFKVTKNTLARIALQDTIFEGLADRFTGPTAVATSKDPVAAAKVLVDYANENEKLTIVGGSLSGNVIDAENVKALARMPSLNELRAKLLGILVAPATKIAGVMQAPAQKLAGTVNAGASKLPRVLAAYGRTGG